MTAGARALAALCAAFAALAQPLPHLAARAEAAESGLPKSPEEIVVPPFGWQMPQPETLRRVFPKGLVAYVKSDRAAPSVSARIFTGRGFLHDPPDRPGLMELTCASMISGGTSMWSPTHITKQIDLQGMILSAEVHAAYTVLSAEFPPGTARKALYLLAEIVSSPTFDSNAIEAEKARIAFKAGLALGSSPCAAALNLERLAFGLPPVTPGRLTAAMQALDRKEMKECHAQAFGASAIVLSVCGDIEDGAVADIIEYKFDTGGAAVKAPSLDALGSAREHGVHAYRSDDTWAAAAAGRRMRASSPADHPVAELTVALAALLLERSGSLASSRSGPAASPATVATGTAGIAAYLHFQSRPQELPARLIAMRNAFAAIAAGNVDARDFDAARKASESRINALFATSGSSCDAFAAADAMGLGAGYYAACISGLQSLTQEDVKVCAQAFLSAPGPIYSISGNMDRIRDAEVETDAKLSELGSIFTIGD